MLFRKKSLVLLMTAGLAASASATTYKFNQTARGLAPVTTSNTSPSMPAGTAPVPTPPPSSPSPELSTQAIEFGAAGVNKTSSTAGVLLSNRAGAALTVSSIQASGPFSTTHNCPGSLAAGTSCTANVVFMPTEQGTAAGKLTFGTNAGPLMVALSGTGTQALAKLSSDALDLGSAAVGSSVSSTSLTLRNEGNESLTLTTLSSTGAFAAESGCGALPKTLEANQTCSIKVSFTPAESGPASGTLTLTTDTGTKSVSLTGSGYRTDASFADVALLVSGDGVAGSSTVTDSSNSRLAMAVSGNTQVVANPVKMGNGALAFDGASDIVTTTSTAFSFNNLDFTIEFWMYARGYSGSIAGGQLFGTVNGATAGYSINLGESPDRFRVISNARGTWADDLVVSAGGGCTINTWCHMAVVRQGDNLYIFKNGTKVASRTGVLNYNYSGTTAVLGRFSDGPNVRDYNGLIDDLRVTRGVARYTTNFAIPTSAYPTR